MERLGACLATWRRVGRTMAGKQWFRGPERRTMGRMRYAGSPSWLMRIHCPLGLLIGLYARDAAGLRPATAVDVPRLEPAVELRADLAPLAVPAASEQWARWWEGSWPGRRASSCRSRAGSAGCLSEGLVLVSRALRADPEAYRDWLTPVLRDLA